MGEVWVELIDRRIHSSGRIEVSVFIQLALNVFGRKESAERQHKV